MRKNKAGQQKTGFTMLVLDADKNITDALYSYFESSGYTVDTENDPLAALEMMKNKSYDILLLDFIMYPICGDEVVARLRAFDTRIFVIMLTGHREVAPPLNTVRELDIQGYFEKSDRFDQLELLVESCVKSIRQMRTVYRYQDGLVSILGSIHSIHQLLSLEVVFGRILEQMLNLGDDKNGFAWIKPKKIISSMSVETLPDEIFQGNGRYEKELEQFLSEDYPHLKQAVQKAGSDGEILEFEGLFLVPLKANHDIFLGILGIGKDSSYPDVQRRLLAVYGEQVTTALHNTILHMLLNINNRKLSLTYDRMKESYMQTVEALRLLVDAKDDYTRGHSDRVSMYAEKIAEKMGMEESQTECVRCAGLLHDIGKVGVSDAILCKDDKLTEEEFAVIRRHPEIGEKILSCIDMFHNLGEIVRAHHERMDGGGYPDGLSGEQIPLEARMISIADAFDAMMSDRHYRKRLSLEKAKEELALGKGTQFDGRLVEVFLGLIENGELGELEET